MERHYLSALPRKGMRAMSGMKTTKSGRYYLARAVLTPPENLQMMVFPQIETWLLRYRQGQDCQQTLSCLGFLNLLKKFRSVILQDSIILKVKYPQLFIWNHPVFHTDEYLNFADELRSAMETTEHPVSLSLQQVMPDMVAEVNSLKRSLEADSNVLGTKIQRLEQKIDR
jgi:hypothetical protein